MLIADLAALGFVVSVACESLGWAALFLSVLGVVLLLL